MKKLLIIFLLISSPLFSQGPWGPGGNPGGGNNGGGNNGGPCNSPNPPSWCNNTGVPINNGIVYLLIGGLLYGIKKMYDSQKITN
jgi:hypothetical protein